MNDAQIQASVNYLFKTYDRNNDGFITQSEFIRYLESFPNGRAQDARNLFRFNDVNGDGKISKTEWFGILKRAWGPKQPLSFQTPQPHSQRSQRSRTPKKPKTPNSFLGPSEPVFLPTTGQRDQRFDRNFVFRPGQWQ